MFILHWKGIQKTYWMQQTEQRLDDPSKSYEVNSEFLISSDILIFSKTWKLFPNTPTCLHFIGKVFKKPIECNKLNEDRMNCTFPYTSLQFFISLRGTRIVSISHVVLNVSFSERLHNSGRLNVNYGDTVTFHPTFYFQF